MPDIAELRRILDIISDESKQPEGITWDQGYWFRRNDTYVIDETGKDTIHACGTAMCFAGWKVFLDGYTKYAPSQQFGEDNYVDASMRNPVTGKKVAYSEVREYARDRLGLTDDQADLLFSEDNDLEDLECQIDDIEVESKVDSQLALDFA